MLKYIPIATKNTFQDNLPYSERVKLTDKQIPNINISDTKR